MDKLTQNLNTYLKKDAAAIKKDKSLNRFAT